MIRDRVGGDTLRPPQSDCETSSARVASFEYRYRYRRSHPMSKVFCSLEMPTDSTDDNRYRSEWLGIVGLVTLGLDVNDDRIGSKAETRHKVRHVPVVVVTTRPCLTMGFVRGISSFKAFSSPLVFGIDVELHSVPIKLPRSQVEASSGAQLSHSLEDPKRRKKHWASFNLASKTCLFLGRVRLVSDCGKSRRCSDPRPRSRGHI